jgi:hypothetical protein
MEVGSLLKTPFATWSSLRPTAASTPACSAAKEPDSTNGVPGRLDKPVPGEGSIAVRLVDELFAAERLGGPGLGELRGFGPGIGTETSRRARIRCGSREDRRRYRHVTTVWCRYSDTN